MTEAIRTILSGTLNGFLLLGGAAAVVVFLLNLYVLRAFVPSLGGAFVAGILVGIVGAVGGAGAGLWDYLKASVRKEPNRPEL
jgi:hypothetical protein